LTVSMYSINSLKDLDGTFSRLYIFLSSHTCLILENFQSSSSSLSYESFLISFDLDDTWPLKN
jgi:hypothetical protein